MHRDHHKYNWDHESFTVNYLLVSQGTGTGSGHRTLLYGNAVLLRHLNSNMVKDILHYYYQELMVCCLLLYI